MMMLINWLVSTLAIIVAAYVVPGVTVDNFLTALALAVVLGLINALIKPLLVLITLPLNILTLGLFTFVINALLILLAAQIVPGFHVDSFWWALLFSIVLGLINALFKGMEPQKA